MRVPYVANCPNCGAPARGPECEYCGTPLAEPPLDLAVGEIVHASFEKDGSRFEFEFSVDQLELEARNEQTDLYADGMVYYTVCNPIYRVRIGGSVVPSRVEGRDVLVVRSDV